MSEGHGLRLGGLQRDAFEVFVEGADACYDPGEAPADDPPFPGRRDGLTVHVDPGRERAAWERLTAVANELDAMGWVEHRDCMSALASRVGRWCRQRLGNKGIRTIDAGT